MSPRSDIPEPWLSAMENAGLYSFRALAEKAGVGTTTVTGLVYGRRRSDEQTVQAVADALRLPIATTRSWAAVALGEAAPFELPAEANRLTRRERDAVLAVVRAMLDPDGTTAAPATTPDLDSVEGLRLAEDEEPADAPNGRNGTVR